MARSVRAAGPGEPAAYGLDFTAGGERYEVRAQRVPGADFDAKVGASFGLFRQDPTTGLFAKVAALKGGYGTVGESVVSARSRRRPLGAGTRLSATWSTPSGSRDEDLLASIEPLDEQHVNLTLLLEDQVDNLARLVLAERPSPDSAIGVVLMLWPPVPRRDGQDVQHVRVRVESRGRQRRYLRKC